LATSDVVALQAAPLVVLSVLLSVQAAVIVVVHVLDSATLCGKVPSFCTFVLAYNPLLFSNSSRNCFFHKKKLYSSLPPRDMVEGERKAKGKALMVLAATGASNILSNTIEVACSLENNHLSLCLTSFVFFSSICSRFLHAFLCRCGAHCHGPAGHWSGVAAQGASQRPALSTGRCLPCWNAS
jgi:hypothetical protein